MTRDEKVTPASSWAIALNLKNELANLEADRKDAERWRKLIRLIGFVQNGSDVTVKLFWDDATGTPWIYVGRERFYVDPGDFDTLIDSISEPNA